MLSSYKSLRHFTIQATDGEIGQLADVLFDDLAWTVRYLIINTGNWLFSRHVLISPVSVTGLSTADGAMQVKITRQQVELSPSVDTNLPMTRDKEIELAKHYEIMPYWGGAGSFGIDPVPNPALMPATAAENALEHIEREEQAEAPEPETPHLRSAHEVAGYNVEAGQESFGHVDDFLVDSESWQLRYLVVDTGTLLPGKTLLVARDWIDAVDWSSSSIQLDLPADLLRNAPAFDAEQPFERAYEEQLYAYYGRKPYWE